MVLKDSLLSDSAVYDWTTRLLRVSFASLPELQCLTRVGQPWQRGHEVSDGRTKSRKLVVFG